MSAHQRRRLTGIGLARRGKIWGALLRSLKLLPRRAGPTRRPAETVVFGILPDHGIFAFSGHWRAESENCPSSAQKSDRLFSAINPAPVSRRPLCDIRPKALP